ncbi:hypothetical protein [Clostridium sp.]|uniref:hypothetical protein n=1 Tax=Clostridium sp. TaxID=1506 RepID=UPI003F40D8FE
MQKKYIKRSLDLQLSDFKKLKKYKGQVLKYVEICRILGIEVYAGAEAGGQQQLNHMVKMGRFAAFKKVKNGYIVCSVYLKEREIKRKRKRRCKFADATKVLQYNLAQSKNSTAVMSKNKALELSGYVNENYNVARKNIEESAKVLGVDQNVLENFFGYFGNKMKMNFQNTIVNSHAIKEFSNEVIIAKGGCHTVANTKQLESIKEAEKEALAKVRCKTIVGAFMKGKWDNFVKVTKDKLTEIDYYYNGYKVYINRKAVKTTEYTYYKAKANMQMLVEESILKSIEKAKVEESKKIQIRKLIDVLIKDTPIDLVELLA